MDSVNPYRPSHVKVLAPSIDEPMHFSGEITSGDYRRLLTSRVEKLLRLVLFVLALTLTVPLLVIIAVAFLFQRPTVPLGPLLLSTLVMALIWIAAYWVSPTARVRRYLRLHPEMIGQVRGSLSELGLILERPDLKQWFSWSTLRSVDARASGVRIAFEVDPILFLALPNQILPAGYRTHAEAMASEFRKRARSFAELRAESGRVFNKSIGDACFFSGVTNQIRPMKSNQLLSSIISQLVTGIGVTAMAVASSGYGRLMLIVGLYCLAAAAFEAWRYRYGSVTVQHQIWGWVDELGLIYAWDSQAFQYRLECITSVRTAELFLEFEVGINSTLCVMFSQMQDSVAFQKMVGSWRLNESKLDEP